MAGRSLTMLTRSGDLDNMKHEMICKTLLGLCLSGSAVTAAAASSDDAWVRFRADVHDACRILVEAPKGATVDIAVNDFGSESYGSALLRVVMADHPDEVTVCIFDKRTGAAELTAPFAEDVLSKAP